MVIGYWVLGIGYWVLGIGCGALLALISIARSVSSLRILRPSSSP
ncbi:MAG: D-galactonate transporter [Chloroflexi bacterium]|nr:D-galactonate transporter [Chloroflexota bacterium]